MKLIPGHLVSFDEDTEEFSVGPKMALNPDHIVSVQYYDNIQYSNMEYDGNLVVIGGKPVLWVTTSISDGDGAFCFVSDRLFEIFEQNFVGVPDLQ